MLSLSIIMGMLSGFAMFSGLVMANAINPDLRTPGLEQFVEGKADRPQRGR